MTKIDSEKPTEPVSRNRATSTLWSGIVFAALAAVLYTATNSVKRGLASQTPAELVVAFQALFTATCFAPMVCVIAWRHRGRRAVPPASDFVELEQPPFEGEVGVALRLEVTSSDASLEEKNPPRPLVPRSRPSQREGGKSVLTLGVFPPVKICLALVIASLVSQFGGNLSLQWALASIGIAMTVPILMSTMVISGALLGRLFLSEPVSARMWTAILLFVISIFVISAGVGHGGSQSEPGPHVSAGFSLADWLQENLLGVFYAALPGFSFAVLGVAIRASMKYHTPAATPMAFVGVIGGIGLSMAAAFKYGTALFDHMTAQQWLGLLAIGVCNSSAFFCLTMSFKRLPVVLVNATNVAQIAMSAVAGIFIFGESFTGYLFVGLALMLAAYGVLALQKRSSEDNHELATDTSDD